MMSGLRATWKVLIVDDEPEVRQIFSRFLAHKGFEVEQAGSGREALRAHSSFQPDVVLMDIMMPGMDGVETLKQMKSLWSDCKVVIISAVKDEKVFRRCLELGALDYLIKPVELCHLHARIMGKILAGQ